MGDTRSVVLLIPSPDNFIADRWVGWAIYDEKDRPLAHGVEQGSSHTTLLEVLQGATAAARRHLRGAYR